MGAAAGVTYNDSPTITYTPLQGERFARSMMANIPPASVMNVLQAGFPVDVVLRLAVQSINGIDNRRVAGGISREHVRPANPEFYLLLEQLAVSRIPATSATREPQGRYADIGVPSQPLGCRQPGRP